MGLFLGVRFAFSCAGGLLGCGGGQPVFLWISQLRVSAPCGWYEFCVYVGKLQSLRVAIPRMALDRWQLLVAPSGGWSSSSPQLTRTEPHGSWLCAQQGSQPPLGVKAQPLRPASCSSNSLDHLAPV